MYSASDVQVITTSLLAMKKRVEVMYPNNKELEDSNNWILEYQEDDLNGVFLCFTTRDDHNLDDICEKPTPIVHNHQVYPSCQIQFMLNGYAMLYILLPLDDNGDPTAPFGKDAGKVALAVAKNLKVGLERR